jgi:tRNA pseudouridine38-40 synthase
MPKFRLTVMYDGTGLVGWQRQASGTSVQGLLEDALATLDGQRVAAHGAGRTDAGVHALGQVASFTLTRVIDPSALVRALNFHLPPAVRAIAATEVDDAFHARFSARSKIYRYLIWSGGTVPPILHRYVWSVSQPLDVAVMDRAARLLEGTHDFAAFQSAGTEVETTVRTLRRSSVERVPNDENRLLAGLDPYAGSMVCYEVEGDGFLRHMVRSIAGTLVEIGQGRADATRMDDALASRDRTRAGRTAPAEGLFLVGVTY